MVKNWLSASFQTLKNKHLWLSFLLGLSLVFAYSPFSQWWLALVVLPTWLTFVNKQSSNTNNKTKLVTQHGFFFAFGWFASGISWVHVSIAEFGGMPLAVSLLLMLLLCLYLAIYPALACYLTAKLSTKWLSKPDPSKKIHWYLLPAFWLLGEYLRSVVLTGFPWLSLGYTQIDGPLSALAPVIGEIGLSFVLMLFAVSISQLIIKANQKLSIAILITLAISTFTITNHEWVSETGESKNVVLVQGNIEQSIKWQPEQQWPTMLKYLDLTRVNYPADIVVWPESAIPAIETLSTTQEYLEMANKSAGLNSAAIITGIINYNFESKEYFNGIIVLGKKHSEDDEGNYYYGNRNRYYKNHLLPIGEFVPFGDLLRPLAPFFNLPMSSFSRGAYVQNNLLANDTRILPLICFEIAFADQLAANFSNDTNMLLTISNDAWFGNSHGPHQHMDIARMRALEFGRPLLRATNTGVTAITDHLGKTIKQAPQFEQSVIQSPVKLVTGLTPYSRFGNLPIYLLALLSIILIVLFRNKI